MTTLQEVTVNGLAGRKEPIHYELKRDVNIFFGFNGSGKTSLLKILHAGLAGESGSLAGVPFNSASIGFFSTSQDKVIKRSITRQSSDSRTLKQQQRDYQVALERTIAEQGGVISVETAANLASRRFEIGEWTSNPAIKGTGRFRHRYLSTNRLMGDAIPLRRPDGRITEAELDAVFAEQIEQIWRLYTNRVLSEVTEVQSAGLREILQSLLFASSEPTEQSPPEVKEAYERASHFLKRRPGRQNSAEFREFQRRFNEEPHFRSVVQDIDQIERRIEQAEEPRRRLAELVSAFFSEGKTIRFTNRGIQAEVFGEEIQLASMSSGEKQLVRILIEAIMAEDDLIIIDEPELSMHIDWQRNLIHAIQTVNPEAQIIMATHSPDIMENVPDESIFRL
jgi:predicted ATP-dependent endonuclease of OLD family